MPTIILIVLMISLLTTASKNIVYKTIFALIVLIIFSANNLVVSFGRYLPIQKDAIYLSSSPYSVVLAPNGYTANSPGAESCPLEKIIADIPKGSSARIIGNSKIDFSDWAVAYFLEKNRSSLGGPKRRYFGV